MDKGASVIAKLKNKSKAYKKPFMLSFIIYDGSGLCAPNRINAAFVSEVLEYMVTKSSAPEVFINSLPKAGEKGTVQSFLRDTHLQRKSIFKSGWMTGVQCYSGYINKDGKKYIVCVFANNYNCTTSEIKKHIEKILLKLFP